MEAYQRHSRLLSNKQIQEVDKKDDVDASQRYSRHLSNYVDRYRKSTVVLDGDAHTDPGNAEW